MKIHSFLTFVQSEEGVWRGWLDSGERLLADIIEQEMAMQQSIWKQ